MHNSWIMKAITNLAVGSVIVSLPVMYYFKDLNIFKHPSYISYRYDEKKFMNISKFGMDVLLFQYQNCPLCGKVRAYLDYNGIDYKIIEIKIGNKSKLSFHNVKRVPSIFIYESDKVTQLNDSSLIISVLESHKSDPLSSIEKTKEYYPSLNITNGILSEKIDFQNKYQIITKSSDNLNAETTEMKWRKWVDEEFILALYPNIYGTIEEALETFEYASVSGDWKKKLGKLNTWIYVYDGSFKHYLYTKMSMKRYNLKENARESLFNKADEWVTALNNQDFLGGSKPNLADLAVFGVLNSIEGCSAFRELMHHNREILFWYIRTKKSMCPTYEPDTTN